MTQQDGGTSAPRDFRSLRDLMVSRREGLPKRLAQVATYAVANPDAMAFGTAASIAQQAQVQPSTLVRFAQALGYGGFSEFQGVFRDRLRDRAPSYGDRLDALRSHAGPDAGTGAILAGFFEAARQSLVNVQDNLRENTVEAVVSLLARAETIYLIGQRRSYPVTSYMGYAFGKLGIRSTVIGSNIGIDTETLSFATPRDAALAISFAPYSTDTLDFARTLKERNVPLAAITDTPFSPLALEARAAIEIAEADFEGFRCLSATMALAMVLTVCVGEARRKAGKRHRA